MRHFYAVYSMYHPNTASMNRMLSYLDVWGKMDVEVTLVFMLPDRNFSELEIPYKNINVKYIWKMFPIRNFALHQMLLCLYVRHFMKLLHTDDRVYLYGQAYLLSRLIMKKGISVYLEKTEHPDVSNPGHWPYRRPVNYFVEDCKRLNGLFVISQSLKDYFVECGVAEEKIHIINMMVDPSRFSKVRKSDGKSRYIAYCGNVSNKKDGVDLLIRSFSLISSHHPDLYLYIIGKIPSKLSDNVNVQLAKELGISENVVFTGLVSYSEMPQMLTDACMLALNRPNNKQAQFGFPTKLGEYLLTGNPVVITAVGDIPLFIKDGENGMVSSPDNIQEFASKMEWLLEHPEESKQIGEKGRLVALHSFNNKIEARKVVEIMMKV